MCCFSENSKNVKSVCTSDIDGTSEDEYLVELPEHVDNLLLNRDVHRGILGFRYETKDTEIIVYTSIEAKTFCMIMQLKPIPK